VVDGLRHLKLIDEGVIVSASGFSRQARNAAKEHGLRLLEPADLEAMAGGPDLTQMCADYLASLRQRFEYLDLGGIAPRVQNRTVKLRMEDVFVPLQARPELETRTVEAGADWMAEIAKDLEETGMALRLLARRERAVEAEPVNISELLRRPRVVVLGDPGSGKSTLLRHIAYAVACGRAEDVGQATLERLPIFVRIAQFSQAQADHRTLTLDTYIRQTCEPRWAALFRHALDAGEALVLLDGLDEVVDAHQRKSIAEAIQTLVADYPGNAFLVTSRIVGYQAARLSGDFAHHTIQPLPLGRITEFVGKWYTAIELDAGAAELSEEYTLSVVEEVRQRAEELSRTIQERPGIQRLAENPLLLTIIALVNWRGRKLPNRRVELYAHAAETLIESWPYRRQGVELDTERVIRLLSPVAYRIFAMRSSGDIPEDELLPILSEAICRVDGVDEREAKVYADEFLGQISERSGIFRERGYDERGRRVFGFLHLTFAEYFTARYLAGLWEGRGEDAEARRALLRQYAHVPRWREVVLLMAGDVGLRDNDRAERATRLLGDILSLGSDYEDQLHRDLLLAGWCLADDLRVQSQAAGYVLDGLFRLALEPGLGEAIRDVFRVMRETAYSQLVLEGLLARLGDEDESVRWMAARALGALGDARAVEGLLVRLENEDGRVRVIAAWALGRIGDARAVEGLLMRLEGEDGSVRASAAGALGEIGDARAVEGLLARLEDEDGRVRASAAGALGEIGDVRAVEGLLARLEDEDGSVRASTVEALGQIGDARAVEGLLVRLEDEEVRVRYSAPYALGEIGDARAVEPLLARLEDEDEGMRGIVAYVLGKFGDARAVEPLLARLEGEEWMLVRGGAYTALVAILGRNAPPPEAEAVACEPQTVPGPWDKTLPQVSNLREGADA
jgi:HEAT repeat protein